MEPTMIAMIVALIFSVVIHEMAHGYAAEWQGDPTARLQGRLSANPLVHLDPFGSVILPAILLYMNTLTPGMGLIFGWAKPVPYNPYNFRNQKWGEALVAAAGPASNIAIALVFAVLIRLSDVLSFSQTFVELSFTIIILNIFLAFFNLVPIPPLDGSKILPRLLPMGLAMQYNSWRGYLEMNPGIGFMIVILLFVFILSAPLFVLTQNIAYLMIGM